MSASSTNSEEKVAALFRSHGWKVQLEPVVESTRADLLASKGALHYAVEVKSASEGRPDRVVALLALAILQASRHASQLPGMQPLAIVRVGGVTPSLLEKVDQFQSQYGQDVAIGIVSDDGARFFTGAGLESMNVAAAHTRVGSSKMGQPRKGSDLFSDLNQWLLKVLLAPEIPAALLSAPRGEYRTISDLAQAAQVSVMSASRFVRRLREDGLVDESGPALRLVRREMLFSRWQSAAMRSSPELRMCFVIPGDAQRQLRKLMSGREACVGLFAAADLLNLGHVSGVPPYVYVRRLSPMQKQAWSSVVPAAAGEQPHVILKQALTPESLFRGAVLVDGMPVSDVLQLWLDTSAHPSRGAEQADFLRRKVLSDVLGAAP